ncbi:MAG: T9SS type A sorting domain-containing protein [Bacteroidales bacterium]|nr:T9SS type A sorting domain-containing protein [Bacteroidales bacterium]
MKPKLMFCLFFLIGFLPLQANQTDSLQNIKITITFASAPSTYSVSKAPLRYNKDFAFSFEVDDGKKDIYSHGYPYLHGGVGPDSTYPGLVYTDGCGNDIKFKMSSALFSFFTPGGVLVDGHDPNSTYAPINVTWPELIEMYQQGWGVVNHGLTSNVPDSLSYDIARNHSYVKLKMLGACPGGPDMRVFANPNGKESYSQPAFDLGYLVCYREGYNFGKPSFNVMSPWNHTDIKMGRTNLYGTINLSDIVDAMAAASINGAHRWGVVFTHYLTNGQYGYTFPVFKNHMRYIADTYGKNGLDNVWMATEEEILEYLLLKDFLTVQTAVNDTILEITFTGNVPSDYRFYNATLMVDAGATIKSITATGVENASFNGIGNQSSMINLSWNGRYVAAPEMNADTWITKTENTYSQLDANIAMDYMAMVPEGQGRDSLLMRLCNIPEITLPEGYCIPGTRIVQDLTVENGQNQCYDAHQTIRVAGEGTNVNVLNGGNLILIAGQNIQLLPGVLVDSGGYFHAYITTANQFCNGLLKPLVANPNDLMTEIKKSPGSFVNRNVLVYPNPVRNNLTIEPSQAGNEGILSLYNINNQEIISRLPFSGKTQLDLTSFAKGIYILKLTNSKMVEVKKIVVD